MVLNVYCVHCGTNTLGGIGGYCSMCKGPICARMPCKRCPKLANLGGKQLCL